MTVHIRERWEDFDAEFEGENLPDYSNHNPRRELRELKEGDVEGWRAVFKRRLDLVARARMSQVVQIFEEWMSADHAELTEEALLELFMNELEKRKIPLTAVQRKIIEEIAPKYLKCCKDVKAEREALLNDPEENNKTAFLKKIGLDWLDIQAVDIVLDHPLFIGIYFHNAADARRFYGRVSMEKEEEFNLVGWFTRGLLVNAPHLSSMLYYVNKEKRAEGQSDVVIHELQHALFQNFYTPEKYETNGRNTKVEEICSRFERDLLDESLAYLKGGKYQTDWFALLSSERKKDEFYLPQVLRRRWDDTLFLLGEFYQKLEKKGVKAEALWLKAQASASWEEFLQIVDDYSNTEKEQKDSLTKEDCKEMEKVEGSFQKRLVAEGISSIKATMASSESAALPRDWEELVDDLDVQEKYWLSQLSKYQDSENKYSCRSSEAFKNKLDKLKREIKERKISPSSALLKLESDILFNFRKIERFAERQEEKQGFAVFKKETLMESKWVFMLAPPNILAECALFFEKHMEKLCSTDTNIHKEEPFASELREFRAYYEI